LQAFPAVSVASYLFSPAVSFVHNRAQFLHRQRRLRYQLAILANAAVTNPGPMRHINLDPVRAVVELLARGLARLDRSVDDLHPPEKCACARQSAREAPWPARDQ